MSPETITAPAPHLVRVEKGQASDEELAAVTALLMARASTRHAAPGDDGTDRSPAVWRRLERARAYRAPHSWQG
ncbi:acyl-CoA carboxylase subunit epsilon [Streptomyces sp. URMC 129]|uniref:acyl-CoA carboxylase subunit epsilon n=1 Tax=Streptomyces sp. URMC 129 TaxID=3423407 RepID=UPI003F1D9D3F